MNLFKVKKGIILEQHKEPALSREIRQFVNAGASLPKTEFGPVTSLDAVTAEDIIEIAKQAKIVDERNGAPLWKNLQKAQEQDVSIVVADAIDDEPYISSQMGILLGLREQAAGGLAAAMKAVGAQEGSFAVYKNLSELEIRIPNQIGGYPVRRIRGEYPAENRLSDELELTVPYATFGVCALVHLYRALYEASVQTTCFVTVAGNCVGYPTNLEVSIGITATQVLERCGLVDNPTRVIIGGSMTGLACIDTDATSISPTTKGVLAFKENEKDLHYSCIGCGRCVGACPSYLNPMYIYRLITTEKKYLLGGLGTHRCIGCGTCSYVCPAKLPLASKIQEYNCSQPERGTDE